MRTYEIPRDYKGEGRVLYVFSTKALIYTAVGAGIGLTFYLIFKAFGLDMLGIIITVILGAIGFAIGTLKVPDTNAFKITKKTGGEDIDEVIKRWMRFKKNSNKIYIYTEEEDTKDE